MKPATMNDVLMKAARGPFKKSEFRRFFTRRIITQAINEDLIQTIWDETVKSTMYILSEKGERILEARMNIINSWRKSRIRLNCKHLDKYSCTRFGGRCYEWDKDDSEVICKGFEKVDK